MVDDNGQLQFGVTSYYRANVEDRAEAWRRLEELQEKVGRSMAEQGVTEENIDRVLQEDG